MAHSRLPYTGDGSTTQYAINFTLGFLDRSHVAITVDGTDAPFTWISDSLVDISTAPSSGAVIFIDRTIPKTVLQHDYSDGSAIDDTHLDESNLAHMMTAHELLDGRLAALASDLDMGGFKITNVGDGTLGTDVMTLTQVTNAIAVASGLSGSFPAAGISYDPSTSALTATDVQAAIDELVVDIAAVTASNSATRSALFKLLM